MLPVLLLFPCNLVSMFIHYGSVVRFISFFQPSSSTQTLFAKTSFQVAFSHSEAPSLRQSFQLKFFKMSSFGIVGPLWAGLTANFETED